MSKTDKTRPWKVAYEDPHNRRFRMVGVQLWPKEGGKHNEWPWKKLTSCHHSGCCNGVWKIKVRNANRTARRRELTRLRQTPMVDLYE